jgi:molybdate/tungstate transport system ATP-binding protein
MIEIKNLSFPIGNFSLNDIDVTIGDGEYFVILGPTGAGKTVLLQCLAGLRKIRYGEIWVNGREITHLAPEERGMGYVPQDYILFPFLNVKENIIFGLKHSKKPKADIHKRLMALTHLLSISHILERDISHLSGGEKQRVALARALAPSPSIVLLDEPLSNLDLQTARHLRLGLKRIHRELGVTTIHITHNQAEAQEMADRIAVISSGKLEQVGRPNEVFFSPENETVSEFIGALNILDCASYHTVIPGVVEVDCGGMRVIVPHEGNSVQKIAVLPRDIRVYDTPAPGPQINCFNGVITAISSLGGIVRLEIKVEEIKLKAEMPSDTFESMSLAIGKEVYVILKMNTIRIYESKPI